MNHLYEFDLIANAGPADPILNLACQLGMAGSSSMDFD